MFLDWIAQLGLLKHDPVSGVLARFPLPVRKTLITEVTSTLLFTSDLSLLSSLAHMQWAMEVLGQGFALPLEELSIAQETTQLYSQWLFEPQLRPLAFREAAGTRDEQLLYQTIFHHYSLLFQVRTTLPTNAGTHPTLSNNHRQHHRHPTAAHSNPSSNLGSTHLHHASQSTSSPHVPIGVLIQRHIELCKKVLTVLTMAGRQLGGSFSDETWEVLLKVVLGITDSLLREQPNKPFTLSPEHAKMSDDLCEHLLRVLFELWLRSNIRQVEMWNILKQCFAGWTHRIPVVHQWAASSLGLCQRVVRLLYGPGHGSDLVNLAVGGYNIGLDLQADFVLYAWHRIIYLLASPSELSPTNCLAAVNGIGRMVETFLMVSSASQSAIPGSPPLPSTPTDIFSSSSMSLSNHPIGRDSLTPSKPTPPDGNTIMHMFGAWLFDISSSPTPEPGLSSYSSHWQAFSAPFSAGSYHEAQASAFGVLCRIFSKPQPPARPFLRIYTERFYEALSMGLRSETSLPTILTHSAELFTSELEGVRMMVPDFVVGIRMAMSGQIRVSSGYMSQERQKQIIEELHLAALKVAGCLICLPNHFEKVELKEGWNAGLSKSNNMGQDAKGPREDKEILAQLIRVLYTPEPATDGSVPASKRFTTLKYYILEMLLNCLETETSSSNLRYLLHLIEAYVFEDVAFCPGLVGVVVKTIQEKIVTIQVPVDVALCAFDVLVGCAGLYDYVRRDSKSCARELVLALCRYVDALLANFSALAATHPLVVRAYECMMQWILAGQWIVGDQDCHLAVISSISSGLHIVERVEEHEAAIVPPKPHQEKRRWGGGAAGNAMISVVGAPLSLGKPSSGGAAKLFMVNNKYPGPIKILSQESKKDKERSKNRSANSSISGHVKQHRPDLNAIQHAADVAMTQFSNQLAHFPVWTDDIGPSRMSTLWDDLAVNKGCLNLARDAEGFEGLQKGAALNDVGIRGPTKYFLLNRRTILGCCQMTLALPGEDSQHSLVDERGSFMVVTMRDSSGKNSWKVRTSHRKSMLSGKNQTWHRKAGQQEADSAESHFPRQEANLTSKDSELKSRVLAVEAAEEESLGLRKYTRPNKIVSDPNPQGTDSHDRSSHLSDKRTSQQTDGFDAGESLEKPTSQELVLSTGSNDFRILLAQMGYLSLENRHRIVPLHLSDNLLNELQWLDDLKERDCMGIGVYFAQSGDVSYNELIYGSPSGLPKDFSRFLDCLGWPIQTDTHKGYLGRLDKDVGETAPYFADRNCEVIFHVPYLMQPKKDALAHLQDHRLVDRFRSITQFDRVAVIWVQDRERMMDLLPLIDQNVMVYIMIHPLGGDSAGGLFWIRILMQGSTAGSVRLAANPLMMGPLADGMLVSRHSLGHLVRNTAISADRACRLLTDSFMEPSVARSRYIQEMQQQHMPDESEGISGFYRSMFAT